MILKTIAETKDYLNKARKAGKTIGLVPTMGFLHKGHLTLMEEARKQCDLVIVSIFVNPLQFGVGEDYEEYPRDLSKDVELARGVGVEAIFAPEVKEMYPKGYSTFIDLEKVTEPLCGRSRPGHFRGVATVVTKLFNIIQPDFAYFGQKDAQQVMVIRTMAMDLNMNLEIVTVPIVREADGLAMSSRNVYLNPQERQQAVVLYQSLQKAKEAVMTGERNPEQVINILEELIKGKPLAQLEYAEILSLPNLANLAVIQGQVLMALAVRFGKTRLIDNLVLEV